MKKLYCFDFDGTLTKEDTMFLFLKFYNSNKYFIEFAKHIPLFLFLKLGLLDAEKVKKSFISGILKGEKKQKIEELAQKFFKENFPNIFRENALDFIDKIDHSKTKSLIVTASLDIWTKPFADHFQMKLVATKAHFENDVFTGNFIGKNCNGEEKVVRIKEEISGEHFDKSIAFGDTKNDQPMLRWANESYFRFFH